MTITSRFVVSGVALLLAAPSVASLGRGVTPSPAARRDCPVQVAGGQGSASSRAHKMEESEDKGLDVEKSWPLPRISGLHHGRKSSVGGYNPERVRLFWRHYHGPGPEPKSKPRPREGH